MTTSYAELSQRKRQRNGNGARNTSQAGRSGASIPAQPVYANKIERVQAMEAAAFSGDWETFKSFLADDVYYRVGNYTEVYGPQAVVEYMKKMLSTELAINDLQIRDAWEAGNTVILELNMAGLRIPDNKHVSYPCVDVYRFEGDKIRDWRVFAVEPTFVV